MDLFVENIRFERPYRVPNSGCNLATLYPRFASPRGIEPLSTPPMGPSFHWTIATFVIRTGNDPVCVLNQVATPCSTTNLFFCLGDRTRTYIRLLIILLSKRSRLPLPSHLVIKLKNPVNIRLTGFLYF